MKYNEPWYMGMELYDEEGPLNEPEFDGTIRAEDGAWVCSISSEANARRIVACVNACRGITNEALEAGVIEDTIDLVCVTESMGITHEGLAPIYKGAKVFDEAEG